MKRPKGEWKEKDGAWFKAERFVRWVRHAKITCLVCGEEFLTKHPKSQSCSAKCRAIFRWRYTPKNERYRVMRMHRKGYVYIRHPETGKEILEHRYVMGKYLQRDLKTTEWVHHINGVTNDNRRENLIILSRGDHNSHHKAEEAAKRDRNEIGKFTPKH